MSKYIVNCPNTAGLSDYYGASHFCNKDLDNQERCSKCWEDAREHYEKEIDIYVR